MPGEPPIGLMIRKIFFWSHLIVGLVASVVVFVLCLSGALLAFERPSLDWAERSALASLEWLVEQGRATKQGERYALST